MRTRLPLLNLLLLSQSNSALLVRLTGRACSGRVNPRRTAPGKLYIVYLELFFMKLIYSRLHNRAGNRFALEHHTASGIIVVALARLDLS